MDIELIQESQLPVEFQYPNVYLAEDFQSASAKFRAWCSEQGVYYYARPRESFSVLEGMSLALQAGCSKLLLEDMS